MRDILQLKRIRWAVRCTLVLGVVASTVANVLHAVDNPVSQTIAAWPPVALLLTIELISRIPVHTAWLARVRMTAAATIASIAAWVSYWHMVGVASRYGERGSSPYLLPLSVDGLIVVASICLIELGDRIRTHETPPIDSPDLDAIIDRWVTSQDWDQAAEIELAEEFLAESPVSPAAPRAERSPRATWDQRKVAELAMAGVKASEANKITGVGVSTYGRWLKVARILKADPHASIDKSERLADSQIQLLRELAR